METHLQLTEAAQGPGERLRAPHPTQVVLVDGHAAVRRSLRRLLAREDDLVLLVEAADLATAMRLVRDRSPDVLVLDLPLPEGSSIEAIGEVRAQVPNTAIIVLTMEASPLFAQRVIDAGAVGFVLKDKADTELAAAVRRAARGHEYVSPHVAVALDALRRAADADGLSPRETEIVRLVALGNTSAEIAAPRRAGALGRHLIGD